MADKGYINKVLTDREEVISQFGYHWTRYMAPKYLFAQIATFIAAGLTAALFGSMGAPGVGVALGALIVWLLTEWLVWAVITADVRVVTNKRVILKEGFFARSTQEIKLSAIEAIEFDQSAMERIFGVGCLKITGRGGGSVIDFHHVANPMDTKHMIENIDWEESKGALYA